MPNTTSCRKFMPETLYVEVPGHGKPFLMLSHPCFPQDEEPEVRMAENLISDGPPSPVVCVSTSCHSIALSCLLGWGPPAEMERCAHLLENIIFMQPQTQGSHCSLPLPLPVSRSDLVEAICRFFRPSEMQELKPEKIWLSLPNLVCN